MVIFHSYVSLPEGIHNDTPLPILNGLEMQWDIYQQYDRGSKFGLGGCSPGVHKLLTIMGENDRYVSINHGMEWSSKWIQMGRV